MNAIINSNPAHTHITAYPAIHFTFSWIDPPVQPEHIICDERTTSISLHIRNLLNVNTTRRSDETKKKTTIKK